MQARISNLKLRDHEICGLSEQVDWTVGYWRKYSLLDERISEQMKSQVHVLSDSVLCLGGQVPDHPDAARIWDNDRVK